MKKLFALALTGLVSGGVWAAADAAWAIKPFSEVFIEVYVKPDSEVPAEKALADAVATVKCNVCHEGKSKKDRNAYGAALSDLLDKKEDAKAPAKIRAAIEKVATMPSDPANPASPTFGALIAEGKLPGGEPK
jgi:mono/diheme cytochrome c family protein